MELRIATRIPIVDAGVTKHLVTGFAVSALALSFAAAQGKRQISDDRELKQIDLTAWDCLNKPGGSARTADGVERNNLKNRTPADISHLKFQDFDVAGYVRSVSAFDAVTVHKRRKDLTPAEHQQLDPIEKEIVQVTGYLGVAYVGPPETTNCASVDFHDWHLEVFEKPPNRPPEPGDPTPIICEITPRTQNAIYADKIRIQELTAFFRKNDLTWEATGHPARKIRLTGYRLWDDEHNGAADVGTAVRRKTPNGYHNPWRQTAWELHPVIKIEALESPMPPVPTSPLPSASAAPSVTPVATVSPTTPATASPTITATTTPAPTPAVPAAPTPQASAPPPQFVTITRPVTIQIPYGKTTLPQGLKLPFVSRDAQNVTVQYMGEKYSIPASSTDLP